MAPSTLLSEIEAFLAETGMSAYYFGILAATNGRLVDRLRGGRKIWPDTEARVRAFIRHERKARRAQKPESAA